MLKVFASSPSLVRGFFLFILVLAARIAPAHSQETPPPNIDHAMMEDLLRRYRDYGLPFPPDDAVLARAPNGSYTQEKSGRYTPYYAVGFWLDQAQGGLRSHGFAVSIVNVG